MNTDLSELLERVNAATGPDRELDAALLRALAPDWLAKRGLMALTASIDAALALVERCLPSANCFGFDKDPRDVTAYVSRNNVAEGHYFTEGIAATPPLAILSALLQALGEKP